MYTYIIHRAIWNNKTMHKGITWIHLESQRESRIFTQPTGNRRWNHMYTPVMTPQYSFVPHITLEIPLGLPLNLLGIPFNLLGILQWTHKLTKLPQMSKQQEWLSHYIMWVSGCIYAFGFSSWLHYSTIKKLICKKMATKPGCNIMLKSRTGSNLFLLGDTTSIQLCLVATMPRVQPSFCQHCTYVHMPPLSIFGQNGQ